MLYAQTGRKIHAMQKSFIIFFMVIQGICLLLRDSRNFTFHRMKKLFHVYNSVQCLSDWQCAKWK